MGCDWNIISEGFLQEVIKNASNYFDSTEFRIDVHHDVLIISVVVDCDAETAYKRMQKFDEEWWLEHINEVNGRVCVTVRFEP